MDDDAYRAFRDELFAAGLLTPTGVDGLYLRSGTFERIVDGINRLVTEAGRDHDAPSFHLPLVVSRSLLEQSDYIRSFPDLAGVVSNFKGGDADHVELLAAIDRGEEWTARLDVTELALCSAACHPLYPTVAGPVPLNGSRYEVFGTCFRHEPSVDPARMQVFRQHEFVYIGDDSGARKHQEVWIGRAVDLLGALGLTVEPVVANDPFFGRTGALLAANQRSDTLKFEIVSPICSTERPTAIASINRHLDHFGLAFGIALEDGSVAQSACVGFGVERITLALLHTHGVDVERWPRAVAGRLEL
jgi:seryl-tRNA synthetase